MPLYSYIPSEIFIWQEYGIWLTVHTKGLVLGQKARKAFGGKQDREGVEGDKRLRKKAGEKEQSPVQDQLTYQ